MIVTVWNITILLSSFSLSFIALLAYTARGSQKQTKSLYTESRAAVMGVCPTAGI
ncbi:hypothetical protein STRDD11_01633 [Streptococcus sp. DD11]|nr:hypothetical protein STRDD11_01633 [Streptococcus sp. DD11]